MAEQPRVSVIVPVRNRRALLRGLLDALAAQTFTDFEVIVVDDGSDDGAPEEAHADADAGRPVRLVRNVGAGAYAARCTGVVASRAPYLAFTDSDCVPSPRWLELGVGALDEGADLVNGRTDAARQPGALERTLYSGTEGLYPTCNVFYRREAYDAAGGFDLDAGDRLGFGPGSTERRMGFGEDTMLAWRVRRGGGRAAHVPEAVVHHHVFAPDLRDSVRRTWMMKAFPALFRAVPELRDGPLARHRVLLNGGRRLRLYAAGALFAGGRRGLATLALTSWVVGIGQDVRARPGTRADHLRDFPMVLALDAVTAVALVSGSVRAKTVLL